VTAPAAMLASRAVPPRSSFSDPRYGEWCAKLGERADYGTASSGNGTSSARALGTKGRGLARAGAGADSGFRRSAREPLAGLLRQRRAPPSSPTDQGGGSRGRKPAGWARTGQHCRWADGAETAAGLCPDRGFLAPGGPSAPPHMNAIAGDLGADSSISTWSACSLEHLGSLDAGRRFIAEIAARCLKTRRPNARCTHHRIPPCSVERQRPIERRAGLPCLYRPAAATSMELAAGLTAAGHHVGADRFRPRPPAFLDQIADHAARTAMSRTCGC